MFYIVGVIFNIFILICPEVELTKVISYVGSTPPTAIHVAIGLTAQPISVMEASDSVSSLPISADISPPHGSSVQDATSSSQTAVEMEESGATNPQGVANNPQRAYANTQEGMLIFRGGSCLRGYNKPRGGYKLY